MDKIKKKRTAVRRRVTLLQDVENELAKQDTSLEKLTCHKETLDDLKVTIGALDNEYLDSMIAGEHDEELVNAETDCAAEYEDKIKLGMVKIRGWMKKNGHDSDAKSSSSDNDENKISEKNRTYKLPKTEIKKFSGALKDWLGWWSYFRQIHDDEGLHSSVKFQYLRQSMTEGTEAAEIVDGFPPTDKNYPLAVEAPKEQYGRDDVQIQVYVRELLGLIIKNVTNKEKFPLSKLVLLVLMKTHLRALQSLNIGNASPETFLFPMVESSLPEEVLRAWQRNPMSRQNGSLMDPPKTKLSLLVEFCETEVRSEQQINLARDGFGVNVLPDKLSKKGQRDPKKLGGSESPATAAALFTSDKSNSCIFCDKTGHNSPECYKARKMSMDEKNEKIKEQRACFKCLKRNHVASKCKGKVKCFICEKPHHQVMCSHKQSKEEEAVTDGVKTMTNIQPTVAMKTSTNEDKVVLRGIMRVKVSGNKNQYREARLLIDSGSDISYIREEFAEELHLTPIGKKVFTTVFGGGYDVCERKQYNVKLEGLPAGKNMLKKTEEIPLFSARTICGDCAPIPVGPWIKDLLKLNVVLTDTYVDSHNIDILIGSNLIGRLVTGRMVKLNTSVIATETTIGWYLNGELPKQKSQTLAARSIIMCTRTKELSALWDLDTLGISDTIQKGTQDEHEAKVKEEFQKNLERDRDGRYVIKLPWLTESMRIPDNRNVAMQRLESTSTRVVTKGEFENYDIFRAWEKEGIIERLDREEKPTGHYLPHRPVFKPESLTTPVRPVFDASCRVGNYPSLNQCLEKGPNLLEIIPKILIRFRAKKVGVISDIRKAFQMIGVNQEDRKFQRFLWWKDFEAKVVQEYQHCRVVFGMNCSPFILAAVLEFHLLHLPEEDKKAGMELLRSLYVDNCVTSFESISQYTEFRAESTAILLHAKMDLREWESNADDKMEREVTWVLGYNWDKSKDEMFCDLPLHLGKEDLNVTKRTVLSIASQVFDPIGFTSPTVLQLKIMLQEAWAQDLKWDELWGTEAINKVKTWCEEARVLSKIRIPRWAVGSIDDLELHTFTDASQNAYSAVVFARSTRESNVCVQLLMAKSRVAPMKKEDPKKNNKKITIPRLELMGCLIGVRLANTVKNALGYEDVKSYFWSDSTTALQWIRRDEIWNTFVGNRIKEINKNSNKEDWRHCPGKQNPADLPSRGCSPTELLNSKWWEGPAWLKLSKEAWPPIKEEGVVEALVQEEKKKSNLTLISRHDSPLFSTKFASYQKNVRVLAYILRFVGKGAVKKPYPKFMTPPELRFAEVILIRVLQRQYFPDAKKVQPRVILMEDNLLHVRTKLEYSDDSDGFRFPMLLPAKCQLVQELIREMHRFHGHGGVQFTVGKLREKYWIQQARKTVTQAIRGCANCRRFDAKPFQVNPVALPEKRVTVGEVFSTTGVDLAGPLYLNDGKKCWIVLYTCAVYRCVELDIVLFSV
ncbi:uncharacterized protein LOC110860058 [Folsomia candida]|uniref:Pro-Pol polyprotein n=1 Tax=Folsomia candida TaxID=158441 RepID=A0A226D8N1_FOLCA|nr:uncharacterized protein LOC110860058 [Folsomia candida]OXA41549.1 Pro-Pol polyprotein [Folsomia candida]